MSDTKQEKRDKVKEELTEVANTSEFAIKLAGEILMHISNIEPDDKMAMQSLHLQVSQIIDINLKKDETSKKT